MNPKCGNFLILSFALFFLCFGGTVGAEEKLGELRVLEGKAKVSLASYLPYYNPNNFKLLFNPEKDSYSPGDSVKFSGTIINNNDYPIADAALYIRISRRPDNAKDGTGVGDFVDEFFAGEAMSLSANSKTFYSASWSVPQGLPSGRYAAYFYFVSSKSFYLAGMPSNENSYGGSCYFGIKDSGQSVHAIFFDKGSVKVSEKKVLPGNLAQIADNKNIVISVSAFNPGSDKVNAKIYKTLFRWDDLKKERQIIEKEDIVTFLPGARLDIEAQFGTLPPGSYLYRIISANEKNKSIFKIRFIVTGKKVPARASLIGVDSYPIKKGDIISFFGVLGALSNDQNFEGKVYLVLRDSNHNILEKVEYSGQITPKLMAIKSIMAASEDYYDFIADMSIYDSEGNIIEEDSVSYNCDNFNRQVSKTKIYFIGDVLHIEGMNICNRPTAGIISLEVKEKNSGKIIYAEKGVRAKELSKSLKLIPGEKYVARAIIDGIAEEVEYQYKKQEKGSWAYWFAGLLILSVVILYIWKKNKSNDWHLV
ncbi:MAG TPA: hypothetical protein PKM84_00170 [Candidatus Pacearchaeota archaeon]|nr:hypothetical protein [Candidatus Pacearchaeota archaeon]